MGDAFLRQEEAWVFVRSLKDPKERLLVELAVGKALVFLAGDPDYLETLKRAPLDLLTYATATHAFLRQQELVRDVLDGRITGVEDLDPFPQS